MFALLIYEHAHKSSKVTKKLYHKIFASEDEGISAAQKLASSVAKNLNLSSPHAKHRKIETFFLLIPIMLLRELKILMPL